MRHSYGMFGLRMAALVAALLLPATAMAQSSTEIIRGRVLGPDSLPLGQAEVLVTGLATRLSRTARTDANGSYTVLFAVAEGDYLVAVRKIGFQSTSFRLTRTGLSSVLGTDVYLRGTVTTLDTVKVTAMNTPGADKPSVGEMSSGSLADVLFMADPTRLLELLLSMPGIYATDSGGFSVGGAGSEQNIATLDGVAVRDRLQLSPDAISSTRIITSSADPARGGGAGGTVSNTLRGGTDIFAATMRGSNSRRQMAWHDAAWPNPVPRVGSFSGTAGGPLKKQAAKYNVSFSLNDRATDWYSLLSPRTSLLSQRGVSLDTVAAMTGAMLSLGIPVATNDSRGSSTSQNLNMTEVLDLTPGATTSIRFSHSFSGNRNFGGGGNSVMSFPTNINSIWSYNNSIQGKLSGYVKGFLNELSLSYNLYQDHSTPSLLLPQASVRVGTEFTDGRTGVANLNFGGGEGEWWERSGNINVQNELSWLPKDGKHKLKIGGQFNFDHSRYYFFPGSPLQGRYTYLSLADLAANTPATYERVINTNPRNTRGANAAWWVGDEWVKSKALQFQGGLRFEEQVPLTIPKYNPAVDSTFGIQTDRIPSKLGISPRLGFSWSSPARRGRGSGGSSSLGGLSADQLRSMPGELVMSMMNLQRSSTLPGIGVTGTFGAFRGVVQNQTVNDLVESTGIASRVTLSCVGTAVPTPDWSTMTEGPSVCAGGSGTSTFAIAKPLVRSFAEDYQPQVRWSSQVAVDGFRLPNKWILGFNGSMAYNVFGQSNIDRNLNPNPKFSLPNEGGRPVYVDATAIVPTTGSISPAASRISPNFTTVTEMVSDLSSYTAQIQASVAPPRPIIRNRVNLQMAYTIATAMNEVRGNSRGGIAGNPFSTEWVRPSLPLHSFRVNASARVWWLNVGVVTSLISGLPLTPTVLGDINGDGNNGNDRAFIPNPATATDTSLARQMNDLLGATPEFARNCLNSQLGRMAGLNGCRMPWQARVDLNASLTPPSNWGYNDRLRVTMNLQNASGGFVRLFHLENTALGRSTLSTQAQNQLLIVNGFDPSTQSFKYRVNQLFGQPSNFGSLRRRYGPMQLHLGLEYRLGGPTPNPISRGLGLREPANKPPLTDDQRRAAVARLRKNPVAPLIQRADSLHLSEEQVTQLKGLDVEFNAKADTALVKLTKWVTRKGQRVFDSDLSLRLAPAQAALTKLNVDYGKKAQAVLTDDQRTQLNGPAKKDK